MQTKTVRDAGLKDGDIIQAIPRLPIRPFKEERRLSTPHKDIANRWDPLTSVTENSPDVNIEGTRPTVMTDQVRMPSLNALFRQAVIAVRFARKLDQYVFL